MIDSILFHTAISTNVYVVVYKIRSCLSCIYLVPYDLLFGVPCTSHMIHATLEYNIV